MSQHAVLSPSGAERWMQCPGSPAMERGEPDTSSSYAEEGTAAHFLASECLENGLAPSDFVGQAIAIMEGRAYWAKDLTVEDPPLPEYAVTADMVRHITDYVTAVRTYAEGGALFVECRLSIAQITGEAGACGTADAVVLTADGELQVHDLKYGMKAVSAERNKQLMFYWLAAFDEYSAVEDITCGRLVIHQPRVRSAPDECPVTLEEAAAFLVQAVTAASKCLLILEEVPASEYGQYLSPSEDACRYCKAAGGCPALAAQVAQIVGADFEDLDAAPPAVPEQGPSLSEKMAACGLVEGWIKAVRGRVESLLLSGAPVPGYKLVQGKMGARKWADPHEAEKVLKSVGLKVDEMYDKTIISPTSADKILGPKGTACSPRKWARVEVLITRTPGGISVAPESDKRPAYEVAQMSDFEDGNSGEDLA